MFPYKTCNIQMEKSTFTEFFMFAINLLKNGPLILHQKRLSRKLVYLGGEIISKLNKNIKK